MFTYEDIFAKKEFIAQHKQFYDRYVKLRVHGYPAQQSFVRVFGNEYWEGPQQGHARVEAIESTQYFLNEFDKVLKATPVSELWNAKLAINGLLRTARDPLVRDSVRLAAEKELNLLTGIVIVDENGKTKVGRTLDDFYKGLEPKEESKKA